MGRPAGAVTPPEWVYLEARVLLLTVSFSGDVTAVRDAVVERIAPKSVRVTYRMRGTDTTERIPLDTLSTAWRGDVGSYRYELVEPTSQRGIAAQQLREWWGLRQKAVKAAERIVDHLDDLPALETRARDLLAYVTAYRERGAHFEEVKALAAGQPEMPVVIR